MPDFHDGYHMSLLVFVSMRARRRYFITVTPDITYILCRVAPRRPARKQWSDALRGHILQAVTAVLFSSLAQGVLAAEARDLPGEVLGVLLRHGRAALQGLVLVVACRAGQASSGGGSHLRAS